MSNHEVSVLFFASGHLDFLSFSWLLLLYPWHACDPNRRVMLGEEHVNASSGYDM
jgi:hypothetical protein